MLGTGDRLGTQERQLGGEPGSSLTLESRNEGLREGELSLVKQLSDESNGDSGLGTPSPGVQPMSPFSTGEDDGSWATCDTGNSEHVLLVPIERGEEQGWFKKLSTTAICSLSWWLARLNWAVFGGCFFVSYFVQSSAALASLIKPLDSLLKRSGLLGMALLCGGASGLVNAALTPPFMCSLFEGYGRNASGIAWKTVQIGVLFCLFFALGSFHGLVQKIGFESGVKDLEQGFGQNTMNDNVSKYMSIVGTIFYFVQGIVFANIFYVRLCSTWRWLLGVCGSFENKVAFCLERLNSLFFSDQERIEMVGMMDEERGRALLETIFHYLTPQLLSVLGDMVRGRIVVTARNMVACLGHMIRLLVSVVGSAYVGYLVCNTLLEKMMVSATFPGAAVNTSLPGVLNTSLPEGVINTSLLGIIPSSFIPGVCYTILSTTCMLFLGPILFASTRLFFSELRHPIRSKYVVVAFSPIVLLTLMALAFESGGLSAKTIPLLVTVFLANYSSSWVGVVYMLYTLLQFLCQKSIPYLPNPASELIKWRKDICSNFQAKVKMNECASTSQDTIDIESGLTFTPPSYGSI